MSQHSKVRHQHAGNGARPTPNGRAAQPTTTEGDGPTYDELYDEARRRNLKGRSKMSKTELERALAL